MGKVGVMGLKAGDFEKGEISDSSSVEEISEEVFSKRENRVVKEPKLQSPMLWTMGGARYVSSLYKLAWAQAVQNKPPASVCKGETEVVVIDEKEEGDLEEGEVDSDSSECVGMKADGLGVERVNSIVESVKNLPVTRNSFRFFCSTKLYNALESLLEVVRENGVVLKDDHIQLLFSAVQSIASVFCSMNSKSRKQNGRALIRFLSLVNSCVPLLFSVEHVKEIEGMVSSKIGTSVLRSRGLQHPLLNPHKDHNADSFPSPMGDLAPSLPIHRVVAPKVPARTEVSKMHIYETEAHKAVLNYQQNFSRSFFTMDRLPSPTPSEELGGKKGKTGGEVSSSPVTGNLRSANPPVLEPTMASAAGVSKSSQSREPKLRLMNSEPDMVDNKTPEVEPLAGKTILKRRKSVDDSTMDGPSMKRRMNPLENSAVIRDVKTVTENDVVRPERVCRNMKPQDPRRVLLGQNVEKAAPIQSVVQPDMPLPFAKNLNNNPNVVSVSQNVSSRAARVVSSVTSRPSPLVSQNVPFQSKQTLSSNSVQHLWKDFEHLFDGYNDQEKAAIVRERTRRIDEQNKLFASNKLCLVLDLDHTLLNSAKFGDVDPVHDKILRNKEEQDREKPHRHLFCLSHMKMWTKLRPGIWNFLEKAAKLFELHLYTMGNKKYAMEMAKLLDPTGQLFKGRVISRGDDGDSFDEDQRVAKSKDLEGVLGMESGVVIIDDSVRVWPHNRLNLITIERYTYFPCSRREFGLSGLSLLEIDHDERPEDGSLACSLSVIERIHQQFFAHTSLHEADVRDILASEKRKILAGCCILFSRVFPVGEANPHLHPLWQTAEQFGAVCTTQMDYKVTHVVANSLGTDKVNWAICNGKFLVSPGWVEASALLYRRANEQDFSIKSLN